MNRLSTYSIRLQYLPSLPRARAMIRARVLQTPACREVISYMYSFKLSALRVTFGDHPRPPTQNFAQEPRRVLCFSWSTYIAKLGWWVCVSQTHSLQSQYQIHKLFYPESHWVSRCKLCVSVRWVPNSSDV